MNTNEWQKQFAFVIPFRSDNGPREKIFQWVTSRIKFFMPEATIYTGESPSGEFNRSAAINNAFSQLKGEEYVIINDSDTIWNLYSIVSGYHALIYDSKFVIPYSNYVGLSHYFTGRLLDGSPHVDLSTMEIEYDFSVNVNPDVYHAPPVSGLTMMRSNDFRKMGGFDERFVGWGEEDVAFVIKARSVLGRPYRCAGPVYHLWHPKSAEYDQPHYAKNRRLLTKEYL